MSGGSHAKHIKYIKRCQSLLPHQYISQDLNHLSLANFTISSLNLLGVEQTQEDRQNQINWIYSHLLPGGRGFRGSLNAALPQGEHSDGHKYDPAYLPATYFAVSNLINLGDDLSGINSNQIMQELCDLQEPHGSFSSTVLYKDIDIRFNYMAVAIRHVLLKARRHGPCDELDLDCVRTSKYINLCRTFDGGYGQLPGAEAHAGLTFCAVAALHLLGRDLKGQKRLATIGFLVHRQHSLDGGFDGRLGKTTDVCYCFWVIASLAVLGASELIDAERAMDYIRSCETRIGGYGKTVDELPDIYHTYLGLAIERVLKMPNKTTCALSIFYDTPLFELSIA